MERKSLRELVAQKQVFAPIVWDVMSAKCAEIAGFEATLLSGGVVAGNCATPDIGLITADDLVRITGYVCQASKLPCCIDADDGYGETPLHAYRTTKRLADAGAMSLTLDDTTGFRGYGRWAQQLRRGDPFGTIPHPCVSRDTFLAKTRASLDACSGSECMLIARTESALEYGIEEAIERCIRAEELGAEMTLVIGLRTLEEGKEIAKYVKGWKMWPDVMAPGGIPDVEFADIEKLGFNFIMMEESVRLVEAGYNPIILREGMQHALKTAEKAITSISAPVRGKKDIAKVASISSGSEEIGALIADTLEKLPPECVIEVQESNGLEITCEVMKGMQFDRGYLTSHMVTDTKHMEAVLEDPLILLTDQKIISIDDLLPILEQVKHAGRSLFIVSDSIETEPLAALIVNRMRGKFSCVCAKAPSFGERKKDLLGDMAVLTGATVISAELGMLLKETTLNQLGRADKVICTGENSTIIGGKGDKTRIENRIDHIRNLLGTAEFDYDKMKLSERLSKLLGGIAVIKVGAPTEVEMQEKKLRIEDAVHAIEAAKKEGIVPGGAMAFIQAAKKIFAVEKSKDESENMGRTVVARALYAPLKQIAENSGVEGGVVLKRVLGSSNPNYGFDARSKRMCDLLECGIIDPTGVVLTALRNAVSVASVVLMAESLVGEMNPTAGNATLHTK